MSRIEYADFRPNTLDLTDVPHGWELMPDDDQRMVFDFLSQTNLASWSGRLTDIEGRNAFFTRIGPTDGIHTHIQASGGFYSEMELIGYGLSKMGKGIHLATADNFVPGRENMFSTTMVTESGEVTSTHQDYVPTGAYTAKQMMKKAHDTLSMSVSLARLEKIRDPDIVPFAVPQLVGIYSYPDIPDPEGNPIYGIVMLTSSPEARMDQQVFRFFGRYGKQYKNTIVERIRKSFGWQFVRLGKALRTFHDYFGLYHRQLTAGNFAVITKPDGTLLPFIADWHTAMRLPESRQANLLARAVDLYVPWESLSVYMAHLLENGNVDELGAAFFPTTVLSNLLGGYVNLQPWQTKKFETAFFDEFDKKRSDHSLQRIANLMERFDSRIGNQ